MLRSSPSHSQSSSSVVNANSEIFHEDLNVQFIAPSTWTICEYDMSRLEENDNDVATAVLPRLLKSRLKKAIERYSKYKGQTTSMLLNDEERREITSLKEAGLQTNLKQQHEDESNGLYFSKKSTAHFLALSENVNSDEFEKKYAYLILGAINGHGENTLRANCFWQLSNLELNKSTRKSLIFAMQIESLCKENEFPSQPTDQRVSQNNPIIDFVRNNRVIIRKLIKEEPKRFAELMSLIQDKTSTNEALRLLNIVALELSLPKTQTIPYTPTHRDTVAAEEKSSNEADNQLPKIFQELLSISKSFQEQAAYVFPKLQAIDPEHKLEEFLKPYKILAANPFTKLVISENPSETILAIQQIYYGQEFQACLAAMQEATLNYSAFNKAIDGLKTNDNDSKIVEVHGYAKLPMQRLPLYQLLFKNLHDNTTKIHDKSITKNLFDDLSNVSAQQNNLLRQTELLAQLDNPQTHINHILAQSQQALRSFSSVVTTVETLEVTNQSLKLTLCEQTTRVTELENQVTSLTLEKTMLEKQIHDTTIVNANLTAKKTELESEKVSLSEQLQQATAINTELMREISILKNAQTSEKSVMREEEKTHSPAKSLSRTPSASRLASLSQPLLTSKPESVVEPQPKKSFWQRVKSNFSAMPTWKKITAGICLAAAGVAIAIGSGGLAIPALASLGAAAAIKLGLLTGGVALASGTSVAMTTALTKDVSPVHAAQPVIIAPETAVTQKKQPSIQRQLGITTMSYDTALESSPDCVQSASPTPTQQPVSDIDNNQNDYAPRIVSVI